MLLLRSMQAGPAGRGMHHSSNHMAAVPHPQLSAPPLASRTIAGRTLSGWRMQNFRES